MDDNAIIELYFARDERALRETSDKYGALIEKFLKTQSADARCVFVRRYWFFDPIAEIAKKYSFSESKVKTLLSRTRGKLKKYLNKEGWFV